MTALDCSVDGLGGRWLPAVLTTDHSASSYGQPVLLLDGTPHSPLDLIHALRPAARDSEHPERFAVMVRIEGSGEPVYYSWRHVYDVPVLRLGDTEPDSPYQQGIARAAADLHAAAAEHNQDLADLTATMVRAIGSMRPDEPPPAEPWQVAAAPEDFVAYRLTDAEWSLARAARRIGYLVHATPFDALDLTPPAAFLRAARAKTGLSQAELGAALSVSANTIARWERGTLRPEHPRMLRLALRALPETINRVIE